MKLKMFSVFDSKLASFSPPFVDHREESAIRRFSDDVNDSNQNNQLFRHPEDFSLFLIGEFDTELADIVCFKGGRNLVTASALKKEPSLNMDIPGIMNGKDRVTVQ